MGSEMICISSSVQIGTASEAMGKVVLDLYDVKDLTVPIKSFPGQDIISGQVCGDFDGHFGAAFLPTKPLDSPRRRRSQGDAP